MRSILYVALLAGILSCAPFPARAGAWYVTTGGTGAQTGADWDNALPTITEGLQRAASGDTVYVWVGTYHERITLKPGVKLSGGYFFPGAWFPFWSFIDGDQQGTVVTVPRGAERDTVLEGFTILHGTGTQSDRTRLGGGIYCESASPSLRYNHITACHADAGGGVYLLNSNAEIAGSHFTHNTANRGGALFADAMSGPTLFCTFRQNEATEQGGAFFARLSPDLVLANSLFEANRAATTGSAVSVDGGLILNNTLLRNSGAADAALTVNLGSAVTVANNIVAGNGAGIRSSRSVKISVHHNDVFGNTAGNYAGIADLTGTDGNISEDPALADPLVGDVTPCPGSPCVDKGDSALAGLLLVDYYQNIRVQGVCVDIGAAEWPQPAKKDAIRVKPDGDDARSGEDWAQAKRTIQAAITDAIASGKEVWVAAGTYQQVVSIVNGNVMLFGGFAGTETARNQRDPAANPTILDLDGTQQPSLITIQGADRATVVDGFTLRHGHGGTHVSLPEGGWAGRGGGMYIKDATPIISRNVIESCSANDDGGGIYIESANPTPSDPPYIACNTIRDNVSGTGAGICAPGTAVLIRQNVIDGNHTFDASQGGGIRFGSATVTGNVIRHNAAMFGGGIYGGWGPHVIRGNRIVDNSGYHEGAALSLFGDAHFTNNLIARNKSVDNNTWGAALFNFGNVTIADNLFDQNQAADPGEAGDKKTADLTCYETAGTICNNTFTNSHGRAVSVVKGGVAFTNNIVYMAEEGIQSVVAPNPVTLSSNCFLTDRDYQNMPPGATDFHADPRFVDSAAGDYRLKADSPCIDMGADSSAAGDWDLDSLPRVQGSGIDIGAYESTSAMVPPMPSALTALRIAGGLETATPASLATLNVDDTGTSQGRIDLRDACRLLRAAVGL